MDVNLCTCVDGRHGWTAGRGRAGLVRQEKGVIVGGKGWMLDVENGKRGG